MRLDNNASASVLQPGPVFGALVRNARMTGGRPEETAAEPAKRQHFGILEFLL